MDLLLCHIVFIHCLPHSLFLSIFSQAKPIDLLAKYANTSEDDMDIEMQEPYHLLRGLNIVDLEDLMEDINVYLEMEKDGVHNNYWKVRVIMSCDYHVIIM